MTYSIDWTDNALLGAMSAADSLAERTNQDPVQWMEALHERVGQLAANPRLAPRWRLASDRSLRQLLYAKVWVVIYQVDDENEKVVVLAVRHGTQRPLDVGDLR